MAAIYAGSNITGTDGVIAIDKVGNAIRFLDPVTLKEIKALPAPSPAVHEMAITPDRRMAYVPLYGDGIYAANKNPNNKILAVDLVDKAIVDVMDLGQYQAPHGMVFTTAGDLWVVCDIPSKLLRIRPERRAIEAAYDTPGKGPHVLAMLPDESRIYTSSKEGDVGVFDIAEKAFVDRVSVRSPGIESGNGTGSEGILPLPDGSKVLVIDNSAKCDLRVIDTRTNALVDRVPLEGFPFTNAKRSRLAKLALSPDQRHLIATSFTGGLAWLIDATDYRHQTVIPLAKGPQGSAYTPCGRFAWVSSHDSGLLTKIDLEARYAVDALAIGNGIEVLAWY
jgi:DNA-binding beta-propeller fold protein YncE